MKQDSVTIDVAGASVTIPAATLARLWLEQVRQSSAIAPAPVTDRPPRIGEAWPGQGGIYAGISRGRDGRPDYHVLLAEAEKVDIKWNDAGIWAKALEADGHKDFALPTRSEQALLFANLKDRFESAYYWSGEAYSSESAWYQIFDRGTQYYDRPRYELRARVVRRIPIQ